MTVIALQSLPLGFRFHPTNEELVNHYLKPKITGRSKSEVEVIAEIDVCKCEPWDLPDKSIIRSDDAEWFFFAPKDRKYPNGHRSNRATEKGYWKATGRDRIIRSKPSAGKSTMIGKKKTLVFHRGRAPKGVRTNWIMHEFRTTEPEFESGDQGGYVLYRLYRKLEEKSSSSYPDEMEPNGFSPTLTKSSPYDNHEEDVMDEMETLLNHDSPSSDLQEEPKSSSDSVQKQPVDSMRWLDGDDYSTNNHVKQEKANTILVSLDEETRVKEKADPLQDVLAQFLEPDYEQTSGVFPNGNTPLLPYADDYYSTRSVNRDSQIGSYQVDNGGEDALDAILHLALSADDCSPSETVLLKEPFRNFPKDTSWDSASCKDSGSCSDIDTELVLPQGADLETLDCFGGSLLPTVSLPLDSSVVYPELIPQFSTLYENATLLPYDISGSDVYSVDSGAESLQDLFNSMEESSNQKIASGNRNSCEGTGIKLRSRQVQQERPNSYFQQGTAARRMRLQCSIGSRQVQPEQPNSYFQQGTAVGRIGLQCSIGNAPPGIVDHGFTGRDDNGNTESTEDLQRELFSCIDKSISENTTVRNIDETLETGIKIRRQKLLNSPDESFTQHDKTFANFSSLVEFQGAYSHCESGIIDNPDGKTETTEAEEHVGDNISEVWDSAPRTVLDKLEGLSIHDANQRPSSSNNYPMFRSVLRFRRKSANDNMLKDSPYPKARVGHSIANNMIYLVSSVVLLLLCVGIWRCLSSGSV